MRLTLEQEQTLSREIIAADNQAEQLLLSISAVAQQLQKPKTKSRHPRILAKEQLQNALQIASSMEDVCLADQKKIEKAIALHNQSETLSWQLATSAFHVVQAEAKKLSCALISEEDLIQEGYIGLLQGAIRYDADRKLRFSTYARWWVRAQMTRAIETKGRMIRLPGGALEQLRQLRHIADQLDHSGKSYTIETLAEEVGIDRKRAELLLKQSAVLSIHQPSDEQIGLEERLSSDNVKTPAEESAQRQALEKLQHSFTKLLDDREQYILINHYGLNGHDPQTMSNIGKSIGLSRERVRQIEAKALMRLKTLF